MSETELSRWPVVLDVPVAWGDMDSFQHVNNTVFLRWCESGRIAYFRRLGLTDRMQETGVGPILARTAIDFRLPITYPDTVTVATTVSRLGGSSFTMDYRITSTAHDGRVAAEAESVIVLVDYAKGGKVALPEDLRAAIGALEAQAAGG